MQDSLFKEFKNIFEETEDAPKKKSERVFGYSPFALQDAVGEKNVKKIWLEYQKLRLEGIEAEELVHKIISKVKEMAAISLGAGKDDLEIKSDYPYLKSKRDLKNWRTGELKSFYTRLVKIYHASRMGNMINDFSIGRGDLDTELEKAILRI